MDRSAAKIAACALQHQRRRRAGKRLLSYSYLCLFLYGLLTGNATAALSTKPQDASIATPPLAASTIDTTEDPKAMGYPDGRKVARDDNGHLYVAYRKKFKMHAVTAYHIFVAKSMDNGHSWQVLNQGRPIEEVGDQNQRVPAIAIDSQGTIHVVWYGKDVSASQGDANQIKYVRSTDHGQSWSAWRNIAYIDGYTNQPMWQEHPTIYVGVNDALFLAWEGYDAHYPTTTQIKFLRSTDGGESWSVWQNVAPSRVNHSRPTVVGNQEGVLYLLAYAQVASRQQVIVSQSTDNGTTWREWSRVAPSLLAQRHISAATDQHGALHVVWQQESFSLRALLPKTPAPTKTEVHYARYDGTGWRDFMRIAPGEGGAQTFPSIQVGSHRKADQAEWEDTVWVAWSESNGGNASASGSTIYATLKAGDTWYPPRAVTAGGEQIYPSFARAPTRYATVAGTPYSLNAVDLVWLYNGPEQKQIYFAQLTETQYHDGGELLAARAAGLPSIQPGAVSAPSVYPMTISIQPHRWLLQWIWQWQLTREAQSLLFILLALAGYLFLKFAFSRWFATTVDQ